MYFEVELEMLGLNYLNSVVAMKVYQIAFVSAFEVMDKHLAYQSKI
jgi:hypothetical protein